MLGDDWNPLWLCQRGHPQKRLSDGRMSILGVHSIPPRGQSPKEGGSQEEVALTQAYSLCPGCDEGGDLFHHVLSAIAASLTSVLTQWIEMMNHISPSCFFSIFVLVTKSK